MIDERRAAADDGRTDGEDVREAFRSADPSILFIFSTIDY